MKSSFSPLSQPYTKKLQFRPVDAMAKLIFFQIVLSTVIFNDLWNH